MTPGEPIPQAEIPKSELAEATEYTLRELISREDRNFTRGSSDVDLKVMASEFSPERWTRYTALCRALRSTCYSNGAVKVMMRDCVPLDPPEIIEPELFVMIRRPNGQEIKFPISRSTT